MRRRSGSSEEDEGFEEGDEGEQAHDHDRHRERHGLGYHRRTRLSKSELHGERPRDRWEKAGNGGVGIGEGKTPPQTVVVRVLRELEDDFTHYKG